MKTFKTLDQLINAKASDSLKSYAYDQPESINWSIDGLRKEIVKERSYQAKKVSKALDKFTAKLNNVLVGQYYIKNFGFVNNEK